MIKQVVVEVEKYAMSVLNTIFPVPVPINCCYNWREASCKEKENKDI